MKEEPKYYTPESVDGLVHNTSIEWNYQRQITATEWEDYWTVEYYPDCVNRLYDAFDMKRRFPEIDLSRLFRIEIKNRI